MICQTFLIFSDWHFKGILYIIIAILYGIIIGGNFYGIFQSAVFVSFSSGCAAALFFKSQGTKKYGAVCDEPYFLCLGRAGICHIDAFFHGCGLYARSACFPLYGCRASGQSQMDRYFIDYN